MPREEGSKFKFSGLESLIILIYGTVWFGFGPVLAIQLAFLIILALWGIFQCKNNLPFSFPLAIYVIFLIWTVYGLTYTLMPSYGIRMILKYAWPLIFAMLCAKVVRRGQVFLYSGMWARFIGTIAIICLIVPGIKIIGSSVFWWDPAVITALITYIIFSLTMADFSNKRKQNLIWGACLCLPCIIVVLRTDILGTAVALAAFSLIKYKFKAVPIIFAIGVLGICAMFLIPSVKNKMFVNPEEVTMEQFVTGNYDENNIQTNFRKFMWDHAKEDFYYGHEMIGSGTGRIQTNYEVELTDVRRGGLPHNDFLIVMCDNGNIGLTLFIGSYILIFIHCLRTFYRYREHPYIRACAMVAGASILGVAVTMYSDNTVSYSMVTLSQPWGFYGMMLGLKHQADYGS